MPGAAPTQSDPIQIGSLTEVALPASFGRGFLRAMEEVFAGYSLHVLLDDLRGGTGESGELRADMSAADFAALQQAVRRYYGTGARRGLSQVGRRTWRTMVASASLSQRLGMLSLRLLSPAERKRKGLEYLAGWLSLPGDPMTIQDLEAGLLVRDPFGATAVGQTAGEPLCWVMVGLIQEAVLWASGEDAEVIETACKAQGTDACHFFIRG